MSDSTPYLDHLGVRRPYQVVPVRHGIPAGIIETIASYATVGAPHSPPRQGWETLVQVHGAEAVLRALRRCANQSGLVGRITSDHVLAILDNRHDQREGPGALRRSRSGTCASGRNVGGHAGRPRCTSHPHRV